jgi:hypothetical protein
LENYYADDAMITAEKGRSISDRSIDLARVSFRSLREAAAVLGRFEIPVGSLKKFPKSAEVENVAVP